MMWDFIVDHTPWWVLPSIAAVALGLTVPYWGPIVGAIWSVMPRWLKWTVGGVATAAATYFAGRNRGARDEQARKDEATRKAIETRNEVQNDVAKADPAAVDKRLDKWMRRD